MLTHYEWSDASTVRYTTRAALYQVHVFHRMQRVKADVSDHLGVWASSNWASEWGGKVIFTVTFLSGFKRSMGLSVPNRLAWVFLKLLILQGFSCTTLSIGFTEDGLEEKKRGRDSFICGNALVMSEENGQAGSSWFKKKSSQITSRYQWGNARKHLWWCMKQILLALIS